MVAEPAGTGLATEKFAPPLASLVQQISMDVSPSRYSAGVKGTIAMADRQGIDPQRLGALYGTLRRREPELGLVRDGGGSRGPRRAIARDRARRLRVDNAHSSTAKPVNPVELISGLAKAEFIARVTAFPLGDLPFIKLVRDRVAAVAGKFAQLRDWVLGRFVWP